MFPAPLRAILLDVDGTLYYQQPLRVLMAAELSTLPLRLMSCKAAFSIIRRLLCFLKSREDLRQIGLPEDLLISELQYVKTGERIGESPELIEQAVKDWMCQRPLKYLKFCRRKGLEEFFATAQSKKIKIGVFSDYPSQEKIEALGIGEWVKLRLCATDKDINAFKPHPRGFLRACEIWGVEPKEVLYIGDREEVDARGAAAAGMPCIILNNEDYLNKLLDPSTTHGRITSFRGLQHVLTTHC